MMLTAKSPHPPRFPWSVLRTAVLPGLALLAMAAAPVEAAAEPPPAPATPVADTVSLPEGFAEAAEAAERRIDGIRLLRTQQALAHDSMEGRRPGTKGIERARALLVERFEEIGLEPAFGGEFLQPFEFDGPGGETIEGRNVVGLIEGAETPDWYLVLTAHYDHLGVRDGEIYNGADDNASGTAAILELAAHFLEDRPSYSIIVAAMDAEEMGLRGARAFVADPPVDRESIVMNVNLDMVSRSEAGELYAAGTYHYPFLVPYLHEVARVSPVTLLLGHDSPELPEGDDWTMASDHGAFHEEGIPFIYFGVEDHPGYHQPTDVFEDVTPEFYVGAVETVLDFLVLMGRVLPHYVP